MAMKKIKLPDGRDWPHKYVEGKGWVPMDMRVGRAVPKYSKQDLKLVSDKPKPTTAADRRKVYEANRRAQKRASKAQPTTNDYITALVERVDRLERDQAQHIDTVGAKLDGFDRRLWTFGADQTAQREELNKINARLEAIEAVLSNPKGKVPTSDEYDKWANRDRPEIGKVKHVIPDTAAKSMYEIEKLISNAMNALKYLRESTTTK